MLSNLQVILIIVVKIFVKGNYICRPLHVLLQGRLRKLKLKSESLLPINEFVISY